MRRRHLALAAMFLLGLAQAGSTIEIVNKEDVTLNMHGRMQLLGFSDYVLDEWRDHVRLYLFLRQARLGFDGHVNSIKYKIVMAQGGEDGVKNTGGTVSNTAQGLLDYFVDVPLNLPVLHEVYLKMGQYKVPFSHERLTDSGDLLFADRSIAHLPFNLGRDVGMSIYDNSDGLAYTAGIFTGGGRDNPIRDIPLRLGTPMVAGRIGYKHNFDDDMYDAKQVDQEGLKPGIAAFANGMYMRDSRVGHSTVLQVKSVEKSLLTDSNWNPFIGMKDVTGGSNFLLGDLWQAGGDVVWRANAGPGLVTTEVEGNYGQYKNDAGWLEMTGARVQVGFFKNPWGIGLRYAVIFADDKFAGAAGRRIFANHQPVHEIAPSLTVFHRKNFKIVADAPILIDTPISIENKLGYYVLMQQTDQTNVGTIIRQTVPSARLVMQFTF